MIYSTGNTKYEFYKKIKKKSDSVLAVLPSQYILKDIGKKNFLPLSGISNKKTILCKRPEDKKFITYKSDRYGFRNKDIYWDEKKINFILLGDSFVHGFCTSSNNIISSQLTKIYKDKFDRKITAINLAIGGNGPLLEYATLKEYSRNIKVKKVIYFFYEGNDFLNLTNELKDPFLSKYLEDDFHQGLVDRQVEVDMTNLNLIEQEIKNKDDSFFKFIKLEKIRNLFDGFLYRKFTKNEPEEIYENFNNILINYKKFTEKQNIEFYFVFLPYIDVFLDNSYAVRSDKTHKKIISLLKNLDIKYIDLLNIVRSELEDPLSIFQSKKHQHLNEKGYKFIAETIVNKLNKIEK